MLFLFGLLFLALILFALVLFWHNQIIPQSFIRLVGRLDYPEHGQRILFLAPHPDDETISAAGYISTALRRGAEVWMVLATDGNKRGLVRRRIREFRKACSILGIPERQQIYWHYSDGSLRIGRSGNIQDNLEEIVQSIRPHIIMAPHIQDTHRDHSVIGETADTTARKYRLRFYQYLVHAHRFPHSSGKNKIDEYLLPPLNLVFHEDWRIFYLSPTALGTKEEALRVYQSQLINPIMRSILFGFLRRNELFSVIDYSK